MVYRTSHVMTFPWLCKNPTSAQSNILTDQCVCVHNDFLWMTQLTNNVEHYSSISMSFWTFVVSFQFQISKRHRRSKLWPQVGVHTIDILFHCLTVGLIYQIFSVVTQMSYDSNDCDLN